MKILVVGSGGREHAIIKKLAESPGVEKIFAAPGNGGIAGDAVCPPLGVEDIEGITQFAVTQSLDLVVVAPEAPLCLGLVDRLAEEGIPAFGPTAAAARLEGSKVFAKDLMARYNIPTAAYKVFEKAKDALLYLRGDIPYPQVVKADGLAAGKGVIICQTVAEAEAAIRSIMEEGAFGKSGSRVVVEEFLAGPEVSVLAFTDGKTLVPMVSSMDHKRALDGDNGPNTGGMGTIAPNPFYTPEVAAACMETIFKPTIAAMAAEGCPFQGCLYFGLMLTATGPKVIEYNCRFGDPETQVVLPLLRGDLAQIMLATAKDSLADVAVDFADDSACCVILASGGYPGSYETGFPISGLAAAEETGALVYHAGVALGDDDCPVTAGGRVLGVTATAKTLAQAVEKAYSAADKIQFQGLHRRGDIGRRAINSKE